MTISQMINSFPHPCMLKYVHQAYIKKIESKFKMCLNLAVPVDMEATIKHIQLSLENIQNLWLTGFLKTKNMIMLNISVHSNKLCLKQ